VAAPSIAFVSPLSFCCAQSHDQLVDLERTVAGLRVDQGECEEAKRLLLSVPFQKIHQRYARTALWQQICEGLNEPALPIPAGLGEDELAPFGAFREF